MDAFNVGHSKKKKKYQRKLWNEKLLAPAGHTQVNKLNAIKCWPYSLFVLIFKRVKDGVRVSNPSANRYLVKKEKKKGFCRVRNGRWSGAVPRRVA